MKHEAQQIIDKMDNWGYWHYCYASDKGIYIETDDGQILLLEALVIPVWLDEFQHKDKEYERGSLRMLSDISIGLFWQHKR